MLRERDLTDAEFIEEFFFQDFPGVDRNAVGGVTSIYDLYKYDREKATALTRLERRLRSIIEAKTDEEMAALTNGTDRK